MLTSASGRLSPLSTNSSWISWRRLSRTFKTRLKRRLQGSQDRAVSRGRPARCRSSSYGSRRPCTTRATWSPMTAARSRRSAIPGSRRRTPTGICLATAGRDGNSITVRGTFNETQEYRRLDVVARNGGSFVALKDVPGPCPGSGWQLLASPGKRGIAGERGERGQQGNPGLSGATIRDWKIDRARYVATPVMSDGREGPPLELRGLFEQFLSEVR